MPKGKFFLLISLAFIAGVFLASFIDLPVYFLRGFLIFAIWLVFLAVILYVRKRPRLATFCFMFQVLCFMFFLGLWRYQVSADGIKRSVLYKSAQAGENVVLIGLVDSDPKIGDRSQQLRVSVDSSENVLVVTGRYPEYHYGDRLKIVGKLQEPENSDKFDYQGWLAKDNIYSEVVFPKIKILQTGQGNAIKSALLGFKREFQETWQRFLSPPQLGVFEALVFGQEQNIPQDWKDKLNLSGTRHLTAVSGMNITVITFLLAPLFLYLGLWPKQADFLALAVIWLYILMIGFPASALRAGIMVSLVFWAKSLGRPASGQRILVFAAVILLLENPLLLRFDPGFQLSFLAMAGLIFWQPFFLEKVFKKWPSLLKTSLATVFAAQVFTLPLTIYNFGYISLVSPLTNVLIGPIVPYLTMAGFVVGALVIVLPFLGQIFSWVFWLATSYILLVVEWCLKIPLSHLYISSLPAWFLLLTYSFLIFLTWRINKLQKLPDFLDF